MRTLKFCESGTARVDGVRLWRRPAVAGIDSLALASQLLAVPVHREDTGRPIADGTAVSIAHSGEVWLLAASSEHGCLGVDVEVLRERPAVLDLARANFPPSEVAHLARLAPAACHRDFTRLWCAREAVLKALGLGLAGGFDRVTFDIDAWRVRAPGWRIVEFRPAPGHLAALALPAG